MPKKVLICGGTVWNGREFLERDVLITDGIITKIESTIEEKAELEFDAENMIVSSGLIDFHTHIKGVSPDDIGIEPEKISYPFGVTHLVDASASQGDGSTISESNCSISVLAEAKIIDNKADFSLTEQIISEYKGKVVGLKVYFDTSFVNVWTVDPLKEICEYSKGKGLFVMVHTTNSPVSMLEVVDALNQGDIISHAFHGGKNSCNENCFESMKKAKEKGIYTDAALCAYYHVNYMLPKIANKKGLYPDIISSDVTKDLEIVSEEKYGLTVCMSILKELGLSDENIFKAVTVTPAGFLKNKENNGCLKVGDRADIAVFKYENSNVNFVDTSGNKLELKKLLKCVLTIVGNQVVYIEK